MREHKYITLSRRTHQGEEKSKEKLSLNWKTLCEIKVIYFLMLEKPIGKRFGT